MNVYDPKTGEVIFFCRVYSIELIDFFQCFVSLPTLRQNYLLLPPCVVVEMSCFLFSVALRKYKISSHVLFCLLPVCGWFCFWQNVVLETPTVAGSTTEAGLSTLPGVCLHRFCAMVQDAVTKLCALSVQLRSKWNVVRHMIMENASSTDYCSWVLWAVVIP